MNRCYRESSIERVAGRLAPGGDAGLDLLARWAAGGPARLRHERAEFAAHVAACARCGGIFSVFLSTERSLLAAAGATSPAPLRPLPVVLSLAAPAQRRRGTIRRGDGLTGSADDAAVEAARDSDRPCYQVAADAGDAQDPAVLPTMAEITLTSEDGRWGVRIKPDPQGEGAIAILVPRRQGAVLRLGGVEHLFDEDGIAHLPSSPIGAAFLILS